MAAKQKHPSEVDSGRMLLYHTSCRPCKSGSPQSRRSPCRTRGGARGSSSRLSQGKQIRQPSTCSPVGKVRPHTMHRCSSISLPPFGRQDTQKIVIYAKSSHRLPSMRYRTGSSGEYRHMSGAYSPQSARARRASDSCKKASSFSPSSVSARPSTGSSPRPSGSA